MKQHATFAIGGSVAMAVMAMKGVRFALLEIYRKRKAIVLRVAM